MLLHQTDLFRPHNDPDDHWDLACAFAIAKLGYTALAGVLIDHPPGPPVLNHASDPDVGAVAQLSHLTGLQPPIAIGNPTYFSARGDALSQPPHVGVDFLLRTLRQSPTPVAISIVGSARDVADAIARQPALFASKCSAIYLVCGSGCPDPAKLVSLEWNVALDPAAYAQIFRAPCPIYWLPCLDDEDRVATVDSRQFAGHFQFTQRDILDSLPPTLRSFFGFMYAKIDSSFWLTALNESFAEVLDIQRPKPRMMYSTPAFFHAAGLGVTTDGDIQPLTTTSANWVYRFDAIDVECNDAGETRWTPATAPGNRYILNVVNTTAYPTAMTRAMKDLLIRAFQ